MIASAAALELVLALIGAELLMFIGYWLITRRHVVALDVYLNLLAAAGLIAAAQSMLKQASWGYGALLLAAALLCHLLALKLCWRGLAGAITA